nr:hypothetical protein CFP56_02635 [Quercus suber]
MTSNNEHESECKREYVVVMDVEVIVQRKIKVELAFHDKSTMAGVELRPSSLPFRISVVHSRSLISPHLRSLRVAHSLWT